MELPPGQMDDSQQPILCYCTQHHDSRVGFLAFFELQIVLMLNAFSWVTFLSPTHINVTRLIRGEEINLRSHAFGLSLNLSENMIGNMIDSMSLCSKGGFIYCAYLSHSPKPFRQPCFCVSN